MNVAGDGQRRRSNLGGQHRIGRQERRLRLERFEIVDDRQRLRDQRAVVELKRWHKRERIFLTIGGLAMLSFQEMHRAAFDHEAF